MFRVAVSLNKLERMPEPHEAIPEVWFYEVEAAGRESAEMEAVRMWREATGIHGDTPRYLYMEALAPQPPRTS